MARRFFLVFALLILADGAAAGSLQFWEDSLGAPGVTATFAPGTGLLADIDFDADSAEGGGLLLGATEIEIRPQGTLVLVGFSCELTGCTQGNDYVFVPGDAAAGGKVVVSDPDFRSKHGVFDLGTVEFDGADPGSLPLVTCNYTGADGIERTCDPFVLVSLPEPGALLGATTGAALLLALRRRRTGR